MNHHNTITISNLLYSWSGAAGQKQANPIVDIPHWTIDTGSSVFLYGRSGSGKSTLLNIIAGILLPQNGFIEIAGQKINHLSQRQRDRFRAQHMGVIFQQFNLIPYLSVQDNIELSAYFSKKYQREINHQEALLQLIEQLDLPVDILLKKATQLSVGQQQRVAVARALYHQPQLIIADEPSSALDAETRDQFIELLLTQCARNNSTVIFVSHDKSLASHFDQHVDLTQINRGQ